MSQKAQVKVEKLEKKFLDWRTDEGAVAESKRIITQMTKNHISYLIRLQIKDLEDDYPTDLPADMMYPGRNLRNESKSVNRESVLFAEAKKIVGTCPINKGRQARFSGDYSAEKILTPNNLKSIKQEPVKHRLNSISSTQSCSSFEHNAIPKLKIKVTPPVCFAGSSSSDSETEQPPLKKPQVLVSNAVHESNGVKVKVKPQAMKPLMKKPGEKIYPSKLNLITSSAETETKLFKTPTFKKPEPIKVHQKSFMNALSLVYTPKVKPVTDSAKTKAETKGKTPSIKKPEEQIKVVKKTHLPAPPLIAPPKLNPAINSAETKPESNMKPLALKTPSMKKPEENIKVIKKTYLPAPPLIDPPNLNPITNKPMKIKKNASALSKQNASNDLHHLGGMFTITNGWDKAESPKKIAKAKPTFEENSQRPPQSIVTNRVPISFPKPRIEAPVEDKTKKRNKFNCSSDSESEDESDDEIKSGGDKKKAVSSDSEDEDTSEVPENMKGVESSDAEVEQSETKRQKLQSDDEDDDQQVLVLDDDIDFDDLDDVDYKPATKQAAVKRPPVPPKVPEIYTTELDDLRMKLTKEPVQSPAKTAKVLDNNIAKPVKRVDDVTATVFKQYFGDVCVESQLNEGCNQPGCKNRHTLPDAAKVRALLSMCAKEEIDRVIRVAMEYPNIYKALFQVIAEIHSKQLPQSESKLARMIMDCERNARSHEMYQHVVNALVSHGNKPRYEALNFLIKHHTESEVAQETIMNLIVDTGPEVVHFTGYLSRVYSLRRKIPDSILSKLIAILTTYDYSQLQRLCVNNLVTKNVGELRKFDTGLVNTFLDHQVEKNRDYDRVTETAKIASIASKVKSFAKPITR